MVHVQTDLPVEKGRKEDCQQGQYMDNGKFSQHFAIRTNQGSQTAFVDLAMEKLLRGQKALILRQGGLS